MNNHISIKETCRSKNPMNTASKDTIAVKGENQKCYIMKFRNSTNDDRLAQEYLAYELCAELSIETPEFDILELDDQIFKNNKKEFEERGVNCKIRKINSDLYFGSQFIEPTENDKLEYDTDLEYDRNSNGLCKDLTKVENSKILAEIIVLTCFIVNGDQFPNVYNILIKEGDNQDKFHVYGIDFGNSFFNNNWSQEKKNYLYEVCNSSNEDKQEIAKKIENYLFDTNIKNNYCLFAMQKYINFQKNNPFEKIVHRIESLSNDFIRKAVNSIPDEWLDSPKEEKEVYRTFLISQKSIIRDIINEACTCDSHHFENWNGQRLQWD